MLRKTIFGRGPARLADSDTPGSKAALGALAGLLPRGLNWAMPVAAASTLSPIKGLVTMAAFGPGTVPALLAAGISASLVPARWRLFGERMAAVLIILMGTLPAARGLGAIFGQGGCCG